jgi:hypothetical protein
MGVAALEEKKGKALWKRQHFKEENLSKSIAKWGISCPVKKYSKCVTFQWHVNYNVMMLKLWNQY